MLMSDPTKGWFEIVEVLKFELNEVMGGNDEYIDKSSDRVSQLFNNIFICRYPRPQKVLFENGSDFKRDFTPLMKDLDIKPVLTTIKNHKLTIWWSGCSK